MAEHGRGDDQVAAGWGKKPGKTRPIVASWASNARCSSMAVACRWRRPSMAPMCMTKSWWRKRSMRFRSSGPSRHRGRTATSLSGQRLRRQTNRAGDVAPEDMLLTFRERRRNHQAETPPRQSSSLESRTHAFLAQPSTAAPDPLGKESRQLSGLLASSICNRRITNRWGSRIGSKTRSNLTATLAAARKSVPHPRERHFTAMPAISPL